MKAGSDREEKKGWEEIWLSAKSPRRLQERAGSPERFPSQEELAGHFLASLGQI